MKSGTDILNELESISSILAGTEKLNVYTVPTGYFEDLSDMILLASKAEEIRLSTTVNEKNGSGVPAGYFDHLATTILSKIKEQENNTSEDLGEELRSVQAKNTYQVPNGYFDTVSDTILNKLNTQTAQEEIRSLSPMLYSIQNENTFEVPTGYFSALSDTILNRLIPVTPKVVVMQKRTAWFKYAVAAAFIGVMSLGVFKYINNQETSLPINYAAIINTNVDGELATISEEEIVNFLTRDGVDVEAAVAFTQGQENTTTGETTDKKTDKTESDEIDELLNQLDENKTMN